MTILNEDVKVMNQAGLTIMESKIYLSLLKFDVASIKEIAKEAEIDRSNCYRTIMLLKDLGLVTMIVGRPNLYVGTPFKKGVKFLLEQQEKKYEDIKKSTAKLANRFEKESLKDDFFRGEPFSIIPKKTRFINRAIKGIDSSEKCIKCISSFARYSQALNYSFESIKSTLENGVHHQTIIDEPKNGQKIPQAMKILMEYPNFEIRYLEKVPEALGSCVDDKRIGILLEPDQNVKESDMLSSIHPSLVAIFNVYFKNLWNESIDLKNFKHREKE